MRLFLFIISVISKHILIRVLILVNKPACLLSSLRSHNFLFIVVDHWRYKGTLRLRKNPGYRSGYTYFLKFRRRFPRKVLVVFWDILIAGISY